MESAHEKHLPDAAPSNDGMIPQERTEKQAEIATFLYLLLEFHQKCRGVPVVLPNRQRSVLERHGVLRKVMRVVKDRADRLRVRRHALHRDRDVPVRPAVVDDEQGLASVRGLDGKRRVRSLGRARAHDGALLHQVAEHLERIEDLVPVLVLVLETPAARMPATVVVGLVELRALQVRQRRQGVARAVNSVMAPGTRPDARLDRRIRAALHVAPAVVPVAEIMPFVHDQLAFRETERIAETAGLFGLLDELGHLVGVSVPGNEIRRNARLLAGREDRTEPDVAEIAHRGTAHLDLVPEFGLEPLQDRDEEPDEQGAALLELGPVLRGLQIPAVLVPLG